MPLNSDELNQQIAELTDVYSGITSVVKQETETVLSGTLVFSASADGFETIQDSFDIEIVIPWDFPDTLPKVWESEGEICNDYNHLNPDGTFCLAVPIAKRQVFFEQPTLLGYVERLVIPYLYGYCFWKKHGYHPFGEAAHGNAGILDHYVDLLKLDDEVAALAVLCYLFEHGYRGHHDCPCGSGLRVRKCHGPLLRSLHEQHTPETLKNEFMAIFMECDTKFQNGALTCPNSLRVKLIRIADNFKSD